MQESGGIPLLSIYSISEIKRPNVIRSYEEARAHFLMEYDRANPITAFDATKSWINY